MRLRNLCGIVLVLGLGLCVSLPGQVPGQGTPEMANPVSPAWAPSGNEAGAPGADLPSVIASTRARKADMPPDARLPLPDDGLPSARPGPGTPTAAARPAPPPPPTESVHQALYVAGSGRPAPSPDLFRSVSAVVRQPAETLTQAGSALSLEVIGPDRAVPGQIYPCVVVVRNISAVILADVRIDLPLPQGAKPMLPAPVLARPIHSLDNHMSWELGNLPVGSERRLTADFRVGDCGEIHLRPKARFSTAVGLRAAVIRPPFSLDVTGPWKSLPGEKVTFAIRVGNNTSDPLRLVQIRCKLGPGLWHAQGELIEAEVAGGLQPGEQRSIQLTAEARGTRAVQIQVTARADGQFTAQADAQVEVSEQALVARLHGPRQALLGKEIAFRLEVDNPGRVTATGLRLRQVLPKGLEFVAASPGGEFDPGIQTIKWSLPQQQVGQRSSVTFQVRAREMGDWALLPAVLADNVSSSTVTHAVHVEAAPNLGVDIMADDDSLDQGRETTYEVRIANQAAMPAHTVRLTVKLPASLALLEADGPTRAQVHGQLLLFAPLPELKGRAVAVYHLRLRGQGVGAGLFHLEVQADGLDRGVQRERTVRVRGIAPTVR